MTEHIMYLTDCVNEIAAGGKTIIDERGAHHLTAALDAMEHCKDVGLTSEDLENRNFENMHREQRGLIPKALLDELIRVAREYWNTSNETLLGLRISTAKRVAKAAGPDWLHILDLVDSIIAPMGLKRDASNEDVYAVLAVLGWEVA